MATSPSSYFSYLLRLWLAGNDDQPEWRLALVDPQTGETRGFAGLETLMSFLQKRMEAATSLGIGDETAPQTSETKDNFRE